MNKKSKGTAFIYFGGEQMTASPDIIINVSESTFGAIFAQPITGCGDINNDGFGDIALGDDLNGPGQSLIYFGGPDADEVFDESLINPMSSGRKFGSASPTVEGDFDADGFPDIVEWNYYTGLIYIYRGGSDFDEIYDIKLADTYLLGPTSTIQFIKNFSEKGRSDLIISNWHDSNSVLYLFYGSSSNKFSADMILKNSLLNADGIASGDFDNDGHIDVFVGNTKAPVDGWVNGGVAQHYVSPVLVGVENKTVERNVVVRLLPNPIKSQLKIECTTNSEENLNILITDTNGAIVYKGTGFSNSSTLINLENLSKGMYFVTINSRSFSISKKVVKL